MYFLSKNVKMCFSIDIEDNTKTVHFIAVLKFEYLRENEFFIKPFKTVYQGPRLESPEEKKIPNKLVTLPL